MMLNDLPRPQLRDLALIGFMLGLFLGGLS